ncbi:uncharacterized protein LOC128390474 [Panonychus citri]|uniref:uncharacterized protein LOC128390474 n=1 Tax=Panonychus citri TaxID=50023 RepID=UPI002307444C|nr:uncharacterized protein LOC128390474 [Panonychus citri]
MSNPKALEKKEEGNRFFKMGNYSSAVSCYSQAIELDKENHLLFGNRAQSYLNLNRPEEAIEDCDCALKLDSNYVKGYLRRGTAFKLLHEYEKAAVDFEKVIQLEPNNKQAPKELKEVQSKIHRISHIIDDLDPDSRVNIDFDTEFDSATSKTSDLKIRSKPKQIPVSTRVINRIPVNSFEFYCDWRELHDDSSKLTYISNIGSVKLGKIFTNSMEPQIFCDILKILTSCVDIPFRSRLLYELSKMKRFQTLILFLEDHEEKILKSLIVDMKSYLDSGEMEYFMEKIGPKFMSIVT